MFDISETCPQPDDREEAPLNTLLEWEREGCGIWVGNVLEIATEIGASNISELEMGEMVTLVGQVCNLRQLMSRRTSENFVVGEISDATDSIKIVCFPRQYKLTQELWAEGSLRIINGRVSEYNDERQIIVESILEYQAPPPPVATIVFQGSDPTKWFESYKLAQSNYGDQRVRLELIRDIHWHKDMLVTSEIVPELLKLVA
jgi:DNA polymerase III alpha subunit